CSPPEVMAEAIAEAATALAGSRMRLGAYANAFAATGRSAANAGLSPLRTDTGPARYLELARSWTASGASVIGGCCGIGPEHIRELAASLG
uniref:homocysteine S-methyltransferase family protein n=1 Tax=Geminicoccus harenae TaxID=2498453 RepID=UPI00168BE7B1